MPKTLDKFIAILEFRPLQEQLDEHPEWPYIIFVASTHSDGMMVVAKTFAVHEDRIIANGEDGEPILVNPRNGTLWRVMHRTLARPGSLDVHEVSSAFEADFDSHGKLHTGQYA